MHMCLNVSAVLQIWRAFVYQQPVKSKIQVHFGETTTQGLIRFELARVIHTTRMQAVKYDLCHGSTMHSLSQIQ